MNANNRINYIEFSAENLDAVKDFYGTVFGWTFTDFGPGYVAFSDGNLEGGFEKGSSRDKDGALVILYATDLEKTLGAVESAGGSIEKPIFDFPGGRRFHFRDPSGNELAVWSDA